MENDFKILKSTEARQNHECSRDRVGEIEGTLRNEIIQEVEEFLENKIIGEIKVCREIVSGINQTQSTFTKKKNYSHQLKVSLKVKENLHKYIHIQSVILYGS